MASYADNLLSEISRVRANAIRVASGSHSDRDLEKLIESVGADIELFMKSAVYGGSGRRGISECIVGLAGLGVAQRDIDAFDRLRLAYNKAKHQPGTSLTYAQADRLLADAETAVLALQSGAIAHVNSPEPRQASRSFWLLVGDHLVHGETEIDICLPMPGVDFPPGIDTVNIEMIKWPHALKGLAKAGELREGRGSVPDRVYSTWSCGSDIALIGSWTGQYRDLLRTLLPYEKVVEGLLPGLARGDEFSEALAAMMMSAVDLGNAGELVGNKSEVEAALLSQAETAYSIPASKSTALRAARETSAALKILTEQQRLELTGPFWRDKQDLAEMTPTARTTGIAGTLIVAADGSLFAWNGY